MAGSRIRIDEAEHKATSDTPYDPVAAGRGVTSGLPVPRPALKPVGERIAPAGSIEEKLEAQAKLKRGLPPPRN